MLILTESSSVSPPVNRPPTVPQEAVAQSRNNLNFLYLNQESDHSLDSSFASFANPTETLGQEECNLDMVFHNKALLDIIGIQSTKELHAVLRKHLFVNHEHGKHLSLMTATHSRHSDFIIGQAYKYTRKD